MAPQKRKAVTDDRPSKKTMASVTESDISKPAAKASKQDKSGGERKATSQSVLQQEERAFPRGGASVLTPIEHKQIKAQAERDVLFEQQTGQKAPGRDDADGELFGEEPTQEPVRKKRKTKQSNSTAAPQGTGSGIRIQGLSYKNLAVGSQVLGYVTAITARDIALALPNNLTGYVPITAVSDILNARIERLLAEDERRADDDEDVDLKRLFYVGQWLRATVRSVGSEQAGSKSKRHIELAIAPSQVNGGLDGDSVVVNSMLQAAVRSVEDHGVVMDLGLGDETVKGFVSKKDLGAGFKLGQLQEGQVMMCLVTGKSSNGKVLKLSPDAARFSTHGAEKETPVVSEAPTVEAFLPGTAVSILVTDSGAGGVVGKVMGMVDVTADVMHSGAATKGADMSKKYKIGSKIYGRIVWTLPNADDGRRVGVSLLDHMLCLPPPTSRLPEAASAKLRVQATQLEQHMPISAIIGDAKVVHLLSERGIFLELPTVAGQPAPAFAHISQVSDTRIDVLSSSSGLFKVDSVHKARIIAFNPIDNLYYVSLKQSVLDQAYLRLEDLKVGEVVKGTVERLILGGKTGITGVLVKLSATITGLVPETHFSDAQLQHPERKFREGFPVQARVLSVDLEKRHVRLTFKKSLIDREVEVWQDYNILKPGMEGTGTIVNLLPSGAAVQFFGNVRAWLPVAEMSEGYIERVEQHFRLGQTVNVRILSVNAETQEMKVSCKQSGLFDAEQQEAWEAVSGGQLVSGSVTVKGGESVTVELQNGLLGLIRHGHLADGAPTKADSALSRIRVGQNLTDLLVLGKRERSRQVLLSNKPSLVKAAKAGTLIRSFADVREGAVAQGFVRNVTPEGVYVDFTNGIVGLVPKSQVGTDKVGKPAFGLLKEQTVHTWVLNIDTARERFTLSMREQTDKPAVADRAQTAVHDVTKGQIVKVMIASIKATQLNVRLANGVQGRIDVSEVFDSWDDISNNKAPLQKFKPNEELEAKVLGLHDARNHRFLPISHRQGKAPVFELSAKRSRINDQSEQLLGLDSIVPNASYLAFVNNHGDNCVWVNLSPNVRGRIALMDLSDDAGMLQKVEKSFPIGCALQVTVKAIDLVSGRLDLTARNSTEQKALTLQDISPGMVLPGRVTKVTERAITVQLSDTLAGPVPLVEMSDNYEQLNVLQYRKNDIVRVCVLGIDTPNKKLFLSLRPSKVLSSSLPVKDPQIASVSQLKPGDLVRGFVKHVGDRGVIVSLSPQLDAFVRISDLSDQYVKDWKSLVEIDQLVKGRVTAVDSETKNVQLSLKASHVDEDYVPPISINDLAAGTIVTGKVRKVEDFGAFIDIDNTQPRLSGLCHRSEVAAKRVEDVRKLYSAGDVVKAKVLSVDLEARKISLGLKASYFADVDANDPGVAADDVEDEAASDVGGVGIDDVQLGNGPYGEEDEDVDPDNIADVDVHDGRTDGIDGMGFDEETVSKPTSGLKTLGFDWNGDAFGSATNGAMSDSEPETSVTKKRKRNKPEIKVDMTGDLDKYGPRSESDFERQLLGQPNYSGLWIQYMAFQLQLSEVQRARDIAERALRTINIRETDEKANIWIAWLNLEVEYGDEARVEEVFAQACQVQDSLEMHEKLASIYIDSGKHKRADNIFERIVAHKAFRASPEVWLNYATFLMDRSRDPVRARALLTRALQSIQMNEHRPLTAKFAGLEFRFLNGDPERGRTIFEGLLTEWPKWSSGWDMWVDLERSRLARVGPQDERAEAREKVRALYERMAAQKTKKRRARFVFKQWLEFEEKEGNGKGAERVKALAKEYVESQQAKGEEETEE
ncbi:hypothetical protein BAUCODRAFT_32189 [Baudoinia panamericana UAMH 10762]|uniref:rRNA biogenesis protein RRP5 n=1 Tax=Baudoinia panamericana (strain UAMH 10762) TaxID=717646 RepID=M2NFY7_BAUPA|nr:uncharacterized protein BAUCODRAFT_32189 [Baudoinia panamericana UAMH 10762]EMC98194.1 hypothetical protein BAUCODRAFT_32189 [Baudoinia panamericana UAMH 10762]